MTNKKTTWIKWIIVYLLVLSSIISIILLYKIKDIIEYFNLFLLIILSINLFITIYNIIFPFKKNKTVSDWKLTLIFNSVFSLIAGLNIRAFGFVFNNNYGVDMSPLFVKNQAGILYGLNWKYFNFDTAFYLYDTDRLSGFSLEINLVTLLIFVVLIRQYNLLQKNSAAASL